MNLELKILLKCKKKGSRDGDPVGGPGVGVW